MYQRRKRDTASPLVCRSLKDDGVGSDRCRRSEPSFPTEIKTRGVFAFDVLLALRPCCFLCLPSFFFPALVPRKMRPLRLGVILLLGWARLVPPATELFLFSPCRCFFMFCVATLDSRFSRQRFILTTPKIRISLSFATTSATFQN